MRVFESIQLALIAVAVGLPVVLGRRIRRGRMAMLLLLVLAVQLAFEGYRWQLLLLELATIGLAVGDALWDERRVRGFKRFRRGVLGVVGVAMVGFLPVVLPVPSLPEPAGPFAVGTTTVVLVDADRGELYGLPEPDPDAVVEPAPEGEQIVAPVIPRRVVAQVWYPATPSPEAEADAWSTDLDVVGPAMATRLGFPGFFFNHTEEVLSHSFVDAAPIDGRFPLVLSSHGWTGFRTINLNQAESLASHGFVVVAPDHTYGAIAARFPDDGSVVYLDERALPDETTTEPDAYQEASEVLVETFAGDLGLIIDEMEAGSGGAFGSLTDHVDLEKIGAFGHSTGGGAAVRLCLEDDRCDALLGMDAWVEPVPDDTVAKELQIPSLFMRSDEWRGTPNDRRLRGLAERSPSLAYWIGIVGAGHNDFILTPLFSPIADRLGLKGPIDSDRVVPIVDSYLVSFFERYLLGVGGAGLDRPPAPEVEMEFIP